MSHLTIIKIFQHRLAFNIFHPIFHKNKPKNQNKNCAAAYLATSKISNRKFLAKIVSIQSKCGKIQTKIAPNKDTFYAVRKVIRSTLLTTQSTRNSRSSIPDTNFPFLALACPLLVSVFPVVVLAWPFFCSFIVLSVVAVGITGSI